jgi:hypothetical protein
MPDKEYQRHVVDWSYLNEYERALIKSRRYQERMKRYRKQKEDKQQENDNGKEQAISVGGGVQGKRRCGLDCVT